VCWTMGVKKEGEWGRLTTAVVVSGGGGGWVDVDGVDVGLSGC